MKFFGRGSDGPPDIGQEEEYDSKDEVISDEPEDAGEEKEKPVPMTKSASAPGNLGALKGVESKDFRFERINARLDSVVEWLHQFSERFSYINESIGEVKANSLATEKKLSHAMLEADKVVDVVREVKPENLRVEYQKMDLKLSAVKEKIEANKQLMVDAMNEVNDIRRASEVFVGTDALMKLNKDTKKDLTEMKRLNSRVKMQSDKVQEIYLETGKSFSETQRAMQQAEDVRESFEQLRKEFEALKVSHAKLVSRDDLVRIRRDSSKFVSDMNKVKVGYEKINGLAESALEIAQRNQEDVANIAVKVGDTGAKRISDYEAELDDVLGLISMLSEQVSVLRKKAGVGGAGEITQAVNEVVARRDKVMEVPPRRFPGAIPPPRIPAPAMQKPKASGTSSDIEPIPSPAPEVKEVSNEVAVEPMEPVEEPKKVDVVSSEEKSATEPTKKKVVLKKSAKKTKMAAPTKKLKISAPESLPVEKVEEKVEEKKVESEDEGRDEGFLSKYKKLFD